MQGWWFAFCAAVAASLPLGVVSWGGDGLLDWIAKRVGKLVSGAGEDKVRNVTESVAGVDLSSGNPWAVLVCGSKGFENYRHHADVCHAYQTLVARGVKPERIITLVYDDVPNASLNPMPGSLYNHPDGKDVYKGCKIDYKGEAVTPYNFLNVLQGKAGLLKNIGSGRVLNSTSADNVFINYVGHGAVGMVGFPSNGAVLYENKLLSTLKKMRKRRMYKNLVFYLESCESGSMFVNLPADLGIFATTASNYESSKATYCPPHDDKVGKVHVGSCLGDSYSTHWLEDSDKEKKGENETLLEQFMRVKKRTTESEVSKFGDEMLAKQEAIDNYLGHLSVTQENMLGSSAPGKDKSTPAKKHRRTIDTYDTIMLSHFYQYLDERSIDERSEKALTLIQELQMRMKVDRFFQRLVRSLAPASEKTLLDMSSPAPVHYNWKCQRSVDRAFRAGCNDLADSDYHFKYAKVLVKLCEMPELETETIVSTVTSLCDGAVNMSPPPLASLQ